MVNSIVHETATTKSKPLDLQIYDFKQAFDSMSVSVTMNDLYNIGIRDDNLNLINACDADAKVAIKTPVGLTERVSDLFFFPFLGN